MQIPFVDIFAGPGGLNEGFSKFKNKQEQFAFNSVAAAEMDVHAVATLRLRKFFRLCLSDSNLTSYRDYILGRSHSPFNEGNSIYWERAVNEVLKVELGKESENARFDKLLADKVAYAEHWVLLGGPPCQAYSNIRRWTYRTQDGYDLSADERAHLYKEYLRIIEQFGPSVFVMENVKGVLSSNFFEKIINDLEMVNYKGHKYIVHSLVVPRDHIKRRGDFLVKAEEFGIPQARHRVILLGIRTDINCCPKVLVKSQNKNSTFDAIGDLPKLRSGFSKQHNSSEAWYKFVKNDIIELCDQLNLDAKTVLKLRQESKEYKPTIKNSELARFLLDNHMNFITNHETRGHISSDVTRYAFCGLFGEKYMKSPKTSDFPEHLIPSHKNWSTGKFNDRFRVQLPDRPSSTITSHIAKDGHAYIHYDAVQARSLTVREAARLQTFPDNYHFEGPRTEQYKQVGNAVPPLLAQKIAGIVFDVLKA